MDCFGQHHNSGHTSSLTELYFFDMLIFSCANMLLQEHGMMVRAQAALIPKTMQVEHASAGKSCYIGQCSLQPLTYSFLLNK